MWSLFSVPGQPPPSSGFWPMMLALLAAAAASLLQLYRFTRRRTGLAGAPAPDEVGRLAAQVAVLGQRVEELRQVACLDPLTGLPNGRALEQELLPQAIASAQELCQPLTVAYVDLDGTKQINDAEGHDVADEVIYRAARTMDATLRKGRCTDRVARRYVGDEFVILLPGARREDAERCLADVWRALGAAGIPASIGAVIVEPGRYVPARKLLAESDRTMRKVKAGGKNGLLIVEAPR